MLHKIIYRFHKIILISAIIITVGAAILASRLRLDLNFFSLLPTGNQSVRAFFSVTEKIGLQSYLIAIVNLPADFSRDKAESFVDIFSGYLKKSPLIDGVDYKGSEKGLTSFFNKFIEYLPLFLKEDELEKLKVKLSDSEIENQIARNKMLLASPLGASAKELVSLDPLGLREVFDDRSSGFSEKGQMQKFRGYFHSEAGDAYFLFIKPNKPPQDIPFSRKLMTEIDGLKNMALSDFSSQSGTLSPGLDVSYTGGYPIAVNDEEVTKRDIKITIFTSLLAVMLLFGLSFRSIKMLFYVGVPLAFSLVWTFGFAVMAFDSLNILTCIFSCVLIGLGIDFAIHIINRFFIKENKELDISQRLEITFREAGTGIITGGITTAVAFYSVAISSFRGFRELGILTGTGILFCLAAMLFVLPSMLVFFSDRRSSMTGVSIAGFGLKALIIRIFKYPYITLTGSMILLTVLGIQGLFINFDDNLKNFRPDDHKILNLQQQVTSWLGASMGEVLLIAKGKSEENVMGINRKIYDVLEKLKDSGMIAGFRSIGKSFIPPAQQKETREFLMRNSDAFDMKRITSIFNSSLEKNGFKKLDAYDEYHKSLSKALLWDKTLFPSALMETELNDLIKTFCFQENEVFNAVSYVIPFDDLWSQNETGHFRNMIMKELEKAGIEAGSCTLTGISMLTRDLKKLIIENLRSSMWASGLIIILVLFLCYRSLKLVLLSTLPLITGLVILSGSMAVLGLDFNFFNLIVIPMIVGIGIDDGVHLTNTFIQADNGTMPEKLSRTGRAAVLTTLTTIAGFGSIALSSYPGLRSMGYVAVIGIGACLFASIIVLPGIFALKYRNGCLDSGAPTEK
ncbi:MAG: MMPL family transporter [Deltaproteobacteria bacterium]|nr:MMPL family transporter [Deltaproteobacteria bacterium]